MPSTAPPSGERDAESDSLDQLGALGKRLAGDDDGLGEIQEKAAPGVLRFLPPLVQELWARKAYFTVDQDGDLLMEGFYKNGPLKLQCLPSGALVAFDKRGRSTEVLKFDDLVDLNYFWWKQSNTKTAYALPLRPWLDRFIERRMVRRKVIYLPDEPGQELDETT